MRGMLRASRYVVLEPLESMFNVARHGYVQGAIDIIPLEGKSNVSLPSPISSETVGGAENVQQSVDIVSVGVSDPKIIHNQSEHHVTMHIPP